MNMHVTALQRGRKNAAIDRADEQAELKAVMTALADRDNAIRSFSEKGLGRTEGPR